MPMEDHPSQGVAALHVVEPQPCPAWKAHRGDAPCLFSPRLRTGLLARLFCLTERACVWCGGVER